MAATVEEQIIANAIYYDGRAAMYDQRRDEWVASESRILEPALSGLAVGSMIDLGSGTGNTIEAAFHHVNPTRVTAVDASRAMLDGLSRRFLAGAIELVHTDVASYLRRAPRPADLITSFGVFEFVPELPTALTALARHLSPGGRTVFTFEPRQKAGPLSTRQQRYSLEREGSFLAYRYDRADVFGALWRGDPDLTLQFRHLKDVYWRGSHRVGYDLVVADKPK
jgi:ubiquinone/menaquinone biosynthesis C-methylase UbiE